MITNPLDMLFLLMVGHALADYPLQGSLMARFKRRSAPQIRGMTVWPVLLASHGLIHGAFVAGITGSLVLGCVEAAAHALIDWFKCEGRICSRSDQALHIGCKLAWTAFCNF